MQLVMRAFKNHFKSFKAGENGNFMVNHQQAIQHSDLSMRIVRAQPSPFYRQSHEGCLIANTPPELCNSLRQGRVQRKFGVEGPKYWKKFPGKYGGYRSPPAQPRGKKQRLMQYIQKNGVVSGEDESATGLSENNHSTECCCLR